MFVFTLRDVILIGVIAISLVGLLFYFIKHYVWGWLEPAIWWSESQAVRITDTNDDEEYSWEFTAPDDSAAIVSIDTTGTTDSVTFTPDVEGTYLLVVRPVFEEKEN